MLPCLLFNLLLCAILQVIVASQDTALVELLRGEMEAMRVQLREEMVANIREVEDRFQEREQLMKMEMEQMETQIKLREKRAMEMRLETINNFPDLPPVPVDVEQEPKHQLVRKQFEKALKTQKEEMKKMVRLEIDTSEERVFSGMRLELKKLDNKFAKQTILEVAKNKMVLTQSIMKVTEEIEKVELKLALLQEQLEVRTLEDRETEGSGESMSNYMVESSKSMQELEVGMWKDDTDVDGHLSVQPQVKPVATCGFRDKWMNTSTITFTPVTPSSPPGALDLRTGVFTAPSSGTFLVTYSGWGWMPGEQLPGEGDNLCLHLVHQGRRVGAGHWHSYSSSPGGAAEMAGRSLVIQQHSLLSITITPPQILQLAEVDRNYL